MTQFEEGYSAQPTDRTDPPVAFHWGKGPVMDLILQFLLEQGEKCKWGETGIDLDEVFGETGARWLGRYQQETGWRVTSEMNLQTVLQMKRDGFDYIKAAKALRTDKETEFAQSHTNNWRWKPGTERYQKFTGR